MRKKCNKEKILKILTAIDILHKNANRHLATNINDLRDFIERYSEKELDCSLLQNRLARNIIDALVNDTVIMDDLEALVLFTSRMSMAISLNEVMGFGPMKIEQRRK